MTLVLSVRNRDSVWVVVDRRLWYGRHRSPTDSAVKVMCLETTDGIGLLAYAGLGATPQGTQPSDWMSAVLRGHGGLTFEQALGILSDVANRELPRHLALLPISAPRAHFVMIPAFIVGSGPRLYSIDNVLAPKTNRHWYRFTRYQRTDLPGSPCPRIVYGGTGGMYLASRACTFERPLLSLVNAHERGRISDFVIADHLARLNYEAHQRIRDGSVGPRCIVVWRRRRDLHRPGVSGGGQAFYVGTCHDDDSAPIPTIGNGLDVQAITRVLFRPFQKWVARDGGGPDPSEVDASELNRRLAELPARPDEKLR